VIFWAVVSYETNRVIEWFPSRVEAQQMLDTVVADAPQWRWSMCVEAIVLTTGGARISTAAIGRRPWPPLTVVLYVAIVVAAIATASIHDGSDRRWMTAGALLLAVSGGLWLRLWLAWFLLTAVAAGDLVVALVTWPAWWWLTVLVNGTMLALLLARPTRRYARRGRPHLRGLFRRKS
jgi:hypothetical protein